jgi:hypothetical protein
MIIRKPLLAAAEIAGAAAPVAPVAPAPSAAPAAPSTSDIMDDFDKGFGDNPKPATPATPAAVVPPEPPKPAAPAAPADPAKPEKAKFKDPFDEPAEPPKPAAPADPAKPADLAKPAPNTPKELRAVYETTKKELDTLKPKLTQIEAENQQLKAKLAETEKLVPQAEEMAKLKQQLEEKENVIRLAKYEQSDEYKTKFDQPLQQTLSGIQNMLKELTVDTKNEETEEVTSRPATEADFATIYQLPKGAAWKKARELFGDVAPEVMAQADRLRQVNSERQEAIETYRKQGNEIETKRQMDQRVQSEGMARMWTEANEAIKTKIPQFLQEKPDDEEFNEAIKKGTSMVDPAYTDARKKMTPTERITKDAMVRNRAIAFTPMALLIQRQNAQIEQLKSDLAAYEGSEPGTPGSGGGRSASGAAGTKGGGKAADGAFTDIIDGIPG